MIHTGDWVITRYSVRRYIQVRSKPTPPLTPNTVHSCYHDHKELKLIC